MNIVSATNPSNVTDKNKMLREIERNRKQLRESHFNDEKSLKELDFDGRKYNTLVYPERKRKTRPDEHISLIKESGSTYLGNLSVVANEVNISKK